MLIINCNSHVYHEDSITVNKLIGSIIGNDSYCINYFISYGNDNSEEPPDGLDSPWRIVGIFKIESC